MDEKLKIIEDYMIEKDKTDMISSLEKLDKKILEEKLDEYDAKNVKELAKIIIEDFEFLLDMTKDDFATRLYFEHIMETENTEIFSAYQSDIEGLLVFCYDDGECYKFYIPDEIKKIIKKLLKI